MGKRRPYNEIGKILFEWEFIALKAPLFSNAAKLTVTMRSLGLMQKTKRQSVAGRVCDYTSVYYPPAKFRPIKRAFQEALEDTIRHRIPPSALEQDPGLTNYIFDKLSSAIAHRAASHKTRLYRQPEQEFVAKDPQESLRESYKRTLQELAFTDKQVELLEKDKTVRSAVLLAFALNPDPV